MKRLDQIATALVWAFGCFVVTPVFAQGENGRLLEERVGPFPGGADGAEAYAVSQIIESDWMPSDPKFARIVKSFRIEVDPDGPDRASMTRVGSAINFNIAPFWAPELQTAQWINSFREAIASIGIPFEITSNPNGQEIWGATLYLERPNLALLDLLYFQVMRNIHFGLVSGPETLGFFYVGEQGPPDPEWRHHPIASPFWRVPLESDTGTRATWMGRVNDALFPQVDHEAHGRGRLEYTRAGGELRLWWRDAAIGWWHTTESSYPWVWVAGMERWFYYAPGTAHPRWYYDPSIDTWHAVP